MTENSIEEGERERGGGREGGGDHLLRTQIKTEKETTTMHGMKRGEEMRD